MWMWYKCIYIYIPQLEEAILETMTSSLNSSYGIAGQEEVTQTWDIIQTVVSQSQKLKTEEPSSYPFHIYR